MYKLLLNSCSILRCDDSVVIPKDILNADYQNYVCWLNEGNIPDPADIIQLPAPTVVSMAQARLALLGANLLDAVEQNMAAMSKPTQIDWQFRQTVERNSPLVATFANALNLDSDMLDSLFIAASKL